MYLLFGSLRLITSNAWPNQIFAAFFSMLSHSQCMQKFVIVD
uniref:Uncharacterized protein n=1 Tax=Rhizophora mucronata TaxID=61149 RepID=A0A2P2PL15_RHIMU